MRQPRLKAAQDAPAGYYHCLSRVVDRNFIFHTPEKEHFTSLMRECEAFCGVRVLTFCVMSNHFHLLLAVPRRPATPPTAEEVLERLGGLSGHQEVGAVRRELERCRKAGDVEEERRLVDRYAGRTWDLSNFMKLLKQRFTQWYNALHDRKGTLWEERFRSVLVEGAGEALAAIAAYIDLNPVRARLVKDPKDYRWCGYGEAVAGQKPARLGLQCLVQLLEPRAGAGAGSGAGPEAGESETRCQEAYRVRLYLAGDERKETVLPDGTTIRGCLSREEGVKVMQAKGRLPLGEYLRCRVRYFNDGLVFGSREFVETVFQRERHRFTPGRACGARRLPGLVEDWYALRALHAGVFG